MSIAAHISARTIWISDLHLGYKDCKADYLLDFLSNIRCETLYLIGDIIDLWSMKRRFYWPESHYRVLLKLDEIARSGTRIIYIPGNHDEPLKRFDGDLFGPVKIQRQAEHVTANGQLMLVMHGDEMDVHFNFSWLDKLIGDSAYDLLLFINRCTNRLRKLFKLPYFSLAKLIKNNIRAARETIDKYQNFAAAEAKQRGYDGVICGHIHSPNILKINGVKYLNTGDWVENCTAISEDFSGNLHLLHFSDHIHWQQSCEEDDQKDNRQVA